MRDLSLHILNLIENATQAGASVVSVCLVQNPETDSLHLVVEDNGPGIEVNPEEAMSPFYTTKEKHGKKTGLGLSLLRAAANQADGDLKLGVSRMGGAAVEATMRLGHMDCPPLGDLAATLASVVCTNPELELHCHCRVGDKECSVSVTDIANELPKGQRAGLSLARRFSETVRDGLKSIDAVT